MTDRPTDPIDFQNIKTGFVERMSEESHTLLAGEFADVVLDAYAADEVWADSIVRTALHNYCRERLNEAHKQLHGVRAVMSSGRVRMVTASTIKRVRDEASGDIVGLQRAALWDFTRPELESELRELLSGRQELNDRIEVRRELLAAMDRHPECSTVREAWLADGRSLDEIDLSA